MRIEDLPVVNASLNGLSGVFIIAGLIAIKSDRKKTHITAMAAALLTSTIFLACYLTYHFTARITYFSHRGWPYYLYLAILIPHVILAFVVLPLVFVTVIPALRARYDQHRRLARWTWPIWLYVSVTGVLVYLMLYVWFPAHR